MQQALKGRNEVNAEYFISALGLEKHPEGGYYREIYKTGDMIADNGLSNRFDGNRHLATSIYFLLKSGEVSRFHRLKSDELWYYHAGSSLTVYAIMQDGGLKEFRLGLNLEAGELPQVVIPKGCIFGAVVNGGNSFTLMGCMVSPGFDFADFELLPREKLMTLFPQYAVIIGLLT